jgi:hypothetical protein
MATKTKKLSKEQKAQIDELDKLKEDGVLDDDEYAEAVAGIESKAEDSPDTAEEAVAAVQGSDFLEQQKQAAALQSPAEPQLVPEQRPQAAITPAPGAGVSEASKRIDAAGAKPMDQEAYDRANSDEQKAAAKEASRLPNLTEGQRVVVSGDHPEAGRMAYIMGVHYTDGIQDMIAKSGTGEARFADVDHYVLRTRDGRSDVFTATRDQVTPLEVNEGWGRGQI